MSLVVTQEDHLFVGFGSIHWTSEVDGSLTAASIANFNVDFLSPECVIENLRFEVKWGLTLSIPLLLLACFVILYLLAEIRSFIAWRVGHKVPFLYWRYIEDDEDNEAEEDKIRSMKKWQRIPYKLLKSLVKSLKNSMIWIRNFCVWFIKAGCTRFQMRVFADKIINSYCTFISFAFSFIMTANSELFTCTQQPNGSFTLDASPDIQCFKDGGWFAMLPISIIVYLALNVGSTIFFIYLFTRMNRLHVKGSMYRYRFKFVLQRFKHKFFYWEAVVTLRKTFISILAIFFRPMLVIVSAIGIIFIGMVLHMNYVPFKRKFHNIMEYFILLVTLIVLVCGLLFFIDQFPTEAFKKFIQVLAIMVMIGSTLFVVGMILWDANTRKKNEGKRRKRKRREIEAQIQERREKGLPFDDLVHQKRTQYDEQGHVTFVPRFFEQSSESDEDPNTTLNAILENLFSMKRLKRKLFLVNRKRKRAQQKVQKVAEQVQRKTIAIRKSTRLSFTENEPATPTTPTTPSNLPQTPEVSGTPQTPQRKASKLALLKRKAKTEEVPEQISITFKNEQE